MKAYFVRGSRDGEVHYVGNFAPARVIVPVPLHETGHVDDVRFIEIGEDGPVRKRMSFETQTYARRKIVHEDGGIEYTYKLAESQ
jgi:hypothetical protein